VRTLQDDIKLATIVKTSSSLGIDVLALQEVRRTSTGLMTFDDESLRGWQLVWSGHKRKHEHGVAILLAPHVKIQQYQEHQPARIISAMISVKGMRLAILNVYAPTDTTKSNVAKTSFYCALSKAKIELDKTPKYKLVTLGDFNATISSESKNSGAWESIIGHNNPDLVKTNSNGERMLTWCMKHQMKVMNTIFRTKRIHRETWRHAATGMWKRIDYICTTRWVSKFVRSCRVFTGPSPLFDMDHRLLVMGIEFPVS
jgi:exonuclease III